MKYNHPLLRDDVTITVDEQGRAVLYSCLSPEQPRIRMHPTSAQIMINMNGTRTEEEVISNIATITGWTTQRSRDILCQVYERYGGYIIEGSHRPPRNWSQQSVEAIASSNATPPSEPQRRMAAPLVVSWIVTRYCNRRCIYCYNDATFAAEAADENRLPAERMISLLDEAYAIGVQQVKLLGGEPFLYPGAYEFIAQARSRGLDVDVITKWSFDREEAKKLADTGLRYICVSLDSVSPAAGDQLVGYTGYVQDTLSSITNLIGEGFVVLVDCVVCKTNLHGLSQLAERARDLGVVRVNVFEYLSSLGRTIPELELDSADRAQMETVIDKHSDILTAANNSDETIERQCSIAVSELAFLPDGRVPLCYQLPLAYNTDLHYGDLSRQSIMEAWHKWSDMWDMEKFAGTMCYGCSSFDECTSRGRCLSAASANCGQPFGPHPNCPAVR